MTGALEMTCVFAMHYGQKTHFLSKKLLFGRFIGRKVHFETIVPVKKFVISHGMGQVSIQFPKIRESSNGFFEI